MKLKLEKSGVILASIFILITAFGLVIIPLCGWGNGDRLCMITSWLGGQHRAQPWIGLLNMAGLTSLPFFRINTPISTFIMFICIAINVVFAYWLGIFIDRIIIKRKNERIAFSNREKIVFTFIMLSFIVGGVFASRYFCTSESDFDQRNGCYRLTGECEKIVQVENDPAISPTGYLTVYNGKPACYESVIRIIQNPPHSLSSRVYTVKDVLEAKDVLSYCDSRNSQQDRDICYYIYGKDQSNGSVCEKISDALINYRCLLGAPDVLMP